MARYYVTIGLADSQPQTYQTDDLELAKKTADWDEFVEILDTLLNKLIQKDYVEGWIEVDVKELRDFQEELEETQQDEEEDE